MARRDRERRGLEVGSRTLAEERAAADNRMSDPGVARSYDSPYSALPKSADGALERLSQRDDGWLRWVRKRDTDTVYAKWKFTHGRRHNTYIMAVGQTWQATYILHILLLKLEKYDEGDNSDLAVDSYHTVVGEASGNG